MSKIKEELFNAELIRKRQADNPFAKISDIIYEVLTDAILSSSLPAGSKLNVASIAERLGVSNTPVGKAIDRLLESGLVTAVRTDQGKYRNYYVFDLNDESLTSLFVARKAMEGTAAAICAQKCALIDLAHIRRVADDFRAAWQDFAYNADSALSVSERARIDREFHRLLVTSTENKYLIDMFESVEDTISYLSIRTCELAATETGKDNFLVMGSHHNTICQAIESGLPELASSAMVRHLDFCQQRCLMNRANAIRNAVK